jgi:hypothetical protein
MDSKAGSNQMTRRFFTGAEKFRQSPFRERKIN